MSGFGSGTPKVFGTADQVSEFIDEDLAPSEGVPVLRRRSAEASSSPQPAEQHTAPAEVAGSAAQEAGPSPLVQLSEPPTPAPTTPPRSGPVVEPQAVAVARSALRGEGVTVAAPAARASTGVRGVLAKLGLPIAPNEAEREALALDRNRFAAETLIRQSTWTRPVSVLVANPGGGMGKTTVSLLLGGTLAAVRGGFVVIPELADAPGMLAYRAEGTPALGIGELVQKVDTITSAGALDGYTKPQTSFASVIGSTGRRATLTRDDVRAVMAKTGEFYKIRVLDTGNDATSAAFLAAVEAADVLVIPVMGAADSAEHALRLVEGLREGDAHARELAASAIAVRLVDGRTEYPEIVERVDESLAQAGVRRLFTIPYDQHIADRGELTLSRLRPATRDAFTFAAAAVIETLNSVVTHRA
ncbi:conserved hypothetical protein (plasmid) [Clavibacter michiganensis subsp. michiganensis NCPPB 382]|uniref:CobQ/CobB/MinD/ParA nucleotide binding domain-containing protein n=1 Tax=Clavibacter michiganensis subsp. michiganensis (strain NCPPB 382) TaxID=443906 RepID=A5CLJ2_CLAM3|nr:conserved hypothetical protein [Clavibacter michiganensis subsp. michiganensis NCPPB 382]